MRVLLLSGYDAASHKRWREGWAAQFPDIEFTQLALAPRYFNWRIRGSSLTYASLQTAALKADYDLLVCTSMVDLSSLRGMLPRLAHLPTVLYFHENQFDYPRSAQQHSSVEPQIVTLYSSVCADTLVFNSEFNRRGFFSGVRKLCKKLPDGVDLTMPGRLEEKSRVLPVPLESSLFEQARSPAGPGDRRLQLAWNHRWEYDKNPELLYRALQILLEQSSSAQPFTLHLLGQQFRNQPAVFEHIVELLKAFDAAGEVGYVADYQAYLALLRRADIVLSTADHDFQGLSMLEAAALGCIPVAPARQVYPEMLGDDYCYPVTGDLDADAASLAQHLSRRMAQCCGPQPPEPPSLSHLSWTNLREPYRQLLDDTRQRYTAEG